MYTLYVIPIETFGPLREWKLISFQDLSGKTRHPLTLIAKKKNISVIVAVPVGLSDIDSVKKFRQLIRDLIEDDKDLMKVFEESWIEVVNIEKKSPIYDIITLITQIVKLLEKFEHVSEIMFDITLCEDFNTKLAIVKTASILSRHYLKSLNIEVVDLCRTGEKTFKVISIPLDKELKYVDDLQLSLYILEELCTCPDISDSDRYRLSALYGKLSVFYSKLTQGLIFESLREFEELIQVYHKTLNSVENQNVKKFLSILPLREYIPSKVTLEEIVRSIVKMLISSGRISELVQFVRNFALSYMFAFCCYYGFIGREFCNISDLIRLISAFSKEVQSDSVKFLNVIENLFNMFSRSGLDRSLCQGIVTDNIELLGKVECVGSINVDSIVEVVNNVLKKLFEESLYDICSDLSSIFRQLLEDSHVGEEI